MKIELWTDGSCTQGNAPKKSKKKYLKGSGGYGGIIRIIGDNKEIRFYGGKLRTTNNEMELVSIEKGLQIISVEFSTSVSLLIYTDSTWVYKCLTGIWNCTEREEIRTKINNEMNKFKKWDGRDSIFGLFEGKTVKSHSKVHYNDMADRLSNKGRLMVTESESDVQLSYEYFQV